MRIAVTNAVLSNTGDAAIYEGILIALEESGIANRKDVIVFDSNASVTSKLYPEWTIYQQLTVSPPRFSGRVRNVLQSLRRRAVNRLANSNKIVVSIFKLPILRDSGFVKSWHALQGIDYLISSGGTYLVDHYNFDPRVQELKLAEALDCQVVLWTQSMGPFKSQRALSQIREIAAVTQAVYFRDEKSMLAWTGANPEAPRGQVVADAVFSFSRGERATRGSNRSKAFISVREWSRGVDQDSFDSTTYSSSMKSAARMLLKDGWEVRAVSTCQGVPSYAYDDSKLAAEIFRGLDVCIDKEFHRPAELLQMVREVDLVITTRMHLAILALVAGTPVIAVAYEFKTMELFNSLGLGDFVVLIEDFTPAWIELKLTEFRDGKSYPVITADQLESLRNRSVLPANLLVRSQS
ncbi:colanic acid/amylovoran biosynthesis protein [Arthrobacter alpinus]|uniref:Colanic acid/amylovoran biosynthesis protein n=1 Tax=Arthrobacter alpinus TaxID=656366 RepID=A0A1H5KJB7_9MICC|nr:polysaccharide pyruvyl transferase family protein [Arthrobacter alpinus]SEE64201.1 colanic acid/amylovoran biosynthesis protein [Arthrobacter alpinus]